MPALGQEQVTVRGNWLGNSLLAGRSENEGGRKVRGRGPGTAWDESGSVSLSVLTSACPLWAFAGEEPPDLRNPGPRWAEGQAKRPCPACPQEPLGSAQATRPPASPGTAATSLLPSRKTRSEAEQLAPPPSHSRQGRPALRRASASGQEAPGGGRDLHTMGKAGPAHSRSGPSPEEGRRPSCEQA